MRHPGWDTINVLARSHELALLQAQLEATNLTAVSAALNDRLPISFEYPAHAASLVALPLWPLFGFRRRRMLRYGWHGPVVHQQDCDEVRRRLASGMPTISDLGGAGRSTGWSMPGPLKVAADWLLWTGEVATVRRDGWRRVYGLAERVIPSELREQKVDDRSCLIRLTQIATAALGVATTADIADYFRVRHEDVRDALHDAGLAAVRIARGMDRARVGSFTAERNGRSECDAHLPTVAVRSSSMDPATGASTLWPRIEAGSLQARQTADPRLLLHACSRP